MKAQDFLDWMDAAGARFAVDAAEILGLSRQVVALMLKDAKAGRDVEVKKTVALAMTATAQRLKPWDQYER